jgi:hypothetical protein
MVWSTPAQLSHASPTTANTLPSLSESCAQPAGGEFEGEVTWYMTRFILGCKHEIIAYRTAGCHEQSLSTRWFLHPGIERNGMAWHSPSKGRSVKVDGQSEPPSLASTNYPILEIALLQLANAIMSKHIKYDQGHREKL